MDDNAPYIMAIAEAGSISGGARAMHIAQPSMSQRLRRLEEELGTPLFDRQTSPLIPTQAGLVYLEWARKAMESESGMRHEISAIATRVRRRLEVGVSLPRGNGILPAVLQEFYQQVSGCTVFLREAGMPRSHEQLLGSGEIDCTVLTPVRPQAPAVVGTELCRERVLLVAPRSRAIPLCGQGSAYPQVDPRCMADLPFIMPPHHLKHYSVVRSLLDAAGVRVNVVFHSCSNEMTLSMVGRGLGATLMPNTFTYGYPDDRVARYELRGIDCREELWYNRRAGTVPSEDEAIFVRLLKEWIARRPELG